MAQFSYSKQSPDPATSESARLSVRLKQHAMASIRKVTRLASSVLPLNPRQMVFSSFSGAGYSGNPKYLYEYLYKHYPEYSFVWAFQDPSVEIPGPGAKVQYRSAEHFHALATSKYWITDSRMPGLLGKRSDVCCLQLWHGTPLKKLGLDIDDVAFAGPTYKFFLKEQCSDWDFFLSPNAHSTKCFQTAFDKRESEIWELGYPRNDILCRPVDEAQLARIRESVGVPPGKKVVLYAPTWRDDDQAPGKRYLFDLPLDVERLQKKLGADTVLLLRLHYNNRSAAESLKESTFVRNVSRYPDIQELYLISDLLLTDYSSTMFDFALLKRPIVLFMHDFKRYEDVRGFYMDIRENPPGPLVYDHERLEDTLASALSEPSPFVSRYRRFAETYCARDDGHASERVAKRLLNVR